MAEPFYLEPLDPTIAEVFRLERLHVVAPPDMQERVFQAVLMQVIWLASSFPSPSVPPETVSTAPPKTRPITLYVALSLGIFVVGMAAGALLYDTFMLRSFFFSSKYPMPTAMTTSSLAQAPSPEAKPPLPVLTLLTPPEPTLDDLATEKALLEQARLALAKNHLANASSALEWHQSQFPNGQLREERQALDIMLLYGTGKKIEATRRLEAFREQYPESPFLPKLMQQWRANGLTKKKPRQASED